MQESKKRFYDVKIKERYMMEELYKTKIKQYFTASIVGKLEHNFHFELKDSEEILIIPYCYIEWLSPTKVDDKEKLAKFSKRELHAYMNEDGTYRAKIIEAAVSEVEYIGKERTNKIKKIEYEIPVASIEVTGYVTKDGNELANLMIKE